MKIFIKNEGFYKSYNFEGNILKTEVHICPEVFGNDEPRVFIIDKEIKCDLKKDTADDIYKELSKIEYDYNLNLMRNEYRLKIDIQSGSGEEISGGTYFKILSGKYNTVTIEVFDIKLSNITGDYNTFIKEDKNDILNINKYDISSTMLNEFVVEKLGEK